MDKIELIFNMYKDRVVYSKPFKDKMKREYKMSVEEAADLFVKIQNYQINKFGERLTWDNKTFSKSESDIVGRRAAQRKYCKKKYIPKKKASLDNLFGNVMGQVNDLCKQAKELSK